MVRLQSPIVLAVLIAIAVLACSTADPSPAGSVPNIDATADRKVLQALSHIGIPKYMDGVWL